MGNITYVTSTPYHLIVEKRHLSLLRLHFQDHIRINSLKFFILNYYLTGSLKHSKSYIPSFDEEG
jgi:hypothetical protein